MQIQPSPSALRFGSIIPVLSGTRTNYPGQTPAQSNLDASSLRCHAFDLARYVNTQLTGKIKWGAESQGRFNPMLETLKTLDPDFKQDPKMMVAVDYQEGKDWQNPEWKIYLVTGQKDIDALAGLFTQKLLPTVQQHMLNEYHLPLELNGMEVCHEAETAAIETLKTQTTVLPGITFQDVRGNGGFVLQSLNAIA